MSKKNFISLVLGTVGCILFSLGMCMSLVPKLGTIQQGSKIGGAGLIVLLVMVAVRRVMEGKPLLVRLSVKFFVGVLLSVTGIIMLGIGMCLAMAWNQLVLGTAVGLVGIVLLLCLIPLITGIE